MMPYNHAARCIALKPDFEKVGAGHVCSRSGVCKSDSRHKTLFIPICRKEVFMSLGLCVQVDVIWKNTFLKNFFFNCRHTTGGLKPPRGLFLVTRSV